MRRMKKGNAVKVVEKGRKGGNSARESKGRGERRKETTRRRREWKRKSENIYRVV